MGMLLHLHYGLLLLDVRAQLIMAWMVPLLCGLLASSEKKQMRVVQLALLNTDSLQNHCRITAESLQHHCSPSANLGRMHPGRILPHPRHTSGLDAVISSRAPTIDVRFIYCCCGTACLQFYPTQMRAA
jgi:hypothetical protein